MAGRSRAVQLRLIRCGETTWQSDRRVRGVTDLPLSEEGRAAVLAAASARSRRRSGTIHHPPDEAATETARLLAGPSRARTRASDDLADPDLGLLEGLAENDFADRFPKRLRQWREDLLGLVPPEGEAISDARRRLFPALARIIRRSRGAEVGIVLHPIGLLLLRAWLADRPVGGFRGARGEAHLIDDRPRVERYLLAGTVLDALGAVPAAEPS